MSTAGFQIWTNNGNFLQATQDYSNASYIQTVRIAGNGSYSFIYVTVTAKNPIFIIKQCSDLLAGVAEVSRSNNGNGTWTVGFTLGLGSGHWADLCVFDVAASVISSANSGVEVYRADASLAFSDRLPYMRVLGQLVVPDYQYGTTPKSWNGSTPAANCGVLVGTSSRIAIQGFNAHDGNPEDEQIRSEVVAVVGQNIRVSWGYVGTTGFPTWSSSFSSWGGPPPVLTFVDLSRLVYS